MGRRGLGALLVALAVVIVSGAAAKGPGGGPATVVKDYKHDVSPAVRTIKPTPPKHKPKHEEENPQRPSTHVNAPDPVVQDTPFTPAMPSPSLSFDGVAFPGVNCNCAPPDPNGEVGRTQYVQIVNEGFQVFNKSTGASVYGPVDIETLWSGFGGVCQNNGDGDPIVAYDQLADRWVISQFAGSSVPTDECIAVSTTSDATGSYNRYAFHLGTNFFDYPKLAVWPDAYYMSMNVFNSSGTAFLGPQPFAFDRAAMLAGNPATMVTTGITGGSTEETYLPADLDGATPPPSGAPNSFVEWPSGSPLKYKIYHFAVNWGSPSSSTFTLFASPPAAGFTQLCAATRSCVPQLGSTAGLDAIGDRLMFRAAYRNFGDHESLVTNYTVSSGGVAAIRWLELRNVTSGPVIVNQESTYQPDSTWRWMGSAAMDAVGDLAVGFSASSSSINPQIRYAGRLASDPTNTLAQGETTLYAGTGSQTGTYNRWGDYSDLTVDPVDDCTFWYTNEYYSTTSSFNWRTRIGNFKFPSCTSTPKPVLGLSKTADAASVTYGNQVGFTLTLSNVGSVGATGPSVSDDLPRGSGITWSIDSADSGWTLTGTSPQHLAYSAGTLAANASTHVHVKSSTTSGSCGTTLSNTATFSSSDGGSGQASASESVVGPVSTIFSQSFDGVTAPALPAGWSAANASGPTPLWVTSTSTPDTAPNDAFVDDPGVVSDKHLDSPTIAVPAAGAQLTFRSSYNLESGYDGGVLEISIAGGAFQDIVAAGGSFDTGGYNTTISTLFGSPIAGRQAWSGSSGGYVTTTVDLPAAAAGKNVVLRWRMGSDSSVSSTGWRVDSISITSQTCSSSAHVTVGKTADAVSVDAGSQIGFTVTVSSDGTATASTVTVSDALPAGTGLSWTIDVGSDAGCTISSGTLSCPWGSLAPGTSKHVHITSPTTSASCGSYTNTASFTSDAGSGQASASETVLCGQVAQITGSTTCTAFSGGTATTLSAIQYTVKSSRIYQVSPKAFLYWVKVILPSGGSKSFTVGQTITSGGFTTTFGLASGSAVFNGSCSKVSASFSQSGGNVTVSFNAPSAGTYYISVKYNATTVRNQPAPSNPPVHYEFLISTVSGSTAGVDLTP
jgi:uncharacterized repeat protein (TIGR01451 family)